MSGQNKIRGLLAEILKYDAELAAPLPDDLDSDYTKHLVLSRADVWEQLEEATDYPTAQVLVDLARRLAAALAPAPAQEGQP